ncbi:MAG: DegT/DnrJ/EryC1/StrS family aminotransferase, partial [Terriglobia bacterium]
GLQAHLAGARIDTGIHYPIPLHLQEAFSHLGYKCGDFPAAERAADEVLSLPMYPQLRLEQQQRVVETVAEFISSRSDGRHSVDLVERT